MYPTCDPRLHYSDCPSDWWYPVKIFYYALCIWGSTTLTAILSHTVFTFSRKGWPPSSPEVLLVPLNIGGFMIGAYAFTMAFSGGYWGYFFPELLASLPFSISVVCHLGLAILIDQVQSASVQEQMSTSKLKRAALIKTIIVGAIPIASTFVGAALVARFPEWSHYSYVLSTCVPALFSLIFIVYLFIILSKMSKLKLQGKALERMVRKLRFSAIFQALWIISVIAHAAAYSKVLDISHYGGWMGLYAAEYFFATNGMIVLSSLLEKEEFTSKGIQGLRPKIIVRMDIGNTKSAELRVLDRNIEGEVVTTSLSGSMNLDVAPSSPTSSGGSHDVSIEIDGEPNACAAGRCGRIKVDLQTAEELAQPLWKNWPKSWADIFKFPHPVNQKEWRAVAFSCAVTNATALIMGAARPDVNIWYIYAIIVYGYAVRTLSGPRFDIQGWLVILLIMPLLGKPIYVSGHPKRWGHLLCFLCTLGALIAYTCGSPATAQCLIAFLLIGNTCQALYQICWACFSWHIIVMTGLVSEDLKTASQAEFLLNGETEGSYRSMMWASTKKTATNSKSKSASSGNNV